MRKPAENALRSSERWFHAFFEHSPEMIALVDRRGTLLSASPSTRRFFGPSVETSLGRNVFQAVHADDLRRMKQAFAGILRAPGRTAFVQCRASHEGGTWHWVEGTVTNLLSDPSVEAVVANWRDVTGRKRAEEALRRSEARWRAVFENSGVGIALAGPDGVLTAANRAYQEMVGFTEEELRALSFLDITYEEDRPANRALARELWEGKLGQFQHEKRYRRKDGKVIWVRNTVSLAPGTETVPRFAMAIVEDITERKRAEEQIGFQASLLGQVRNAVMALDSQGRITYWNKPAENIYQWRAEEVIGKDAQELLVPPEARALAGEMMRSLEKEGQWEGEFVVQRKDGTRVPVYTVNAVLRDGHDNIAGFVGVSTDITERRREEEKLRRSEDRYRDLVEHSQDLLCTHNLQGQLLSVNRAAARRLGYEPHELLAKSLPELLAPEVREEFPKYISAIRKDGVAQGLMLILARSGERRIWEYHNTLRVEGVPAPVVRGMAHDVTERLQAERTIHSLSRISEKLNSTLDVDTLMNSLILEAMKLTGSEIGWSGLATERGMVSMSCVRGSQVIPFEYCWPPGVGWPGWVLTHKVPYVSNDAAADAVIVPEIRQRWGVKSGLDAPILDNRDEVIGFFEVSNKRSGAYTDSDVEKTVAVSRIASVALQNALRYQKLREAEESLHRLSSQLLQAQDEERRRIARELHDATAQTLAALAINLGVVNASSRRLKPAVRNALSDSFALVESCTREVRTIAYLMHPPLLRELGLASALRWYVGGFTERSGIRVKLEMPPELGEVPEDVALTLYRAVQEGLANVHRHSGSHKAAIRLKRGARAIKLWIEDQGRGISRGDGRGSRGKRPSEPIPGVGIAGMRERVRQLGGQLEIQSDGAKKGTTVTVVLPLSSSSREGPSDP